MQISFSTSTTLVNNIFIESDIVQVSKGSMIYSALENPGQLILIDSGKYRLIDKQKTFGTYTLAKQESTAIFGLSQLLKAPFTEEIRSLTNCLFRVCNLEDLSLEQISFFNKLISSQIDLFESAFIYSKMVQNKILKQNDFQDVLLFNDHLKLLNFREYNNSNSNLVYLDKVNSGFEYSQVIPEKFITKFFNQDNWPRIARLNLAKDSFKPKNINIKSLSEKPVLVEDNESKDSEEYNFFEKEDCNSHGFKFIRGRNRLEAYTACLAMLVEYFELPTRRDTIMRTSRYLDDDNINHLDRILGILDTLGLAVRIVRIDINRPLRLPIPCLWLDDNGIPSIISKVDSKKISLLNPLKGVENLDESDCKERFLKTPNVISISLGLHTPRKRFNLNWLLPYIKRYRLQLIEVFSASFLNQLFALATPLLFQQIIDRVISKGAYDALTPLVILMLMFVLLETVFSSLKTFQFVEVSNRIDVGVGSAIVSRLLRINTRFFDRRPVGELSSRLGELDNIRRFLTGTALTAVLDAIFAVLYFAVMFFYSPLLTLIVFLTIPFLFLVTIGITPITQNLIRRRAEAASRTQSLLVEILNGIQTIKLQNAELTARRQWENRHLNSINQGFKAILANTFSSNALQLINKVSSILIIGVGAGLVLRNELTIGELIAFRIISGYVTQPMLRLASTWQSFQEMSLSLERVGDVVNQPLEVSENEEGNIVMPNVKGSIKVDSVSFSYSSTSRPVLSSVNLDIQEGSFVGVVGQSGCGKSTLIKMIPRLYIPSSGKILIDDYDISKVDLYSFRKQLGFVPQDCMLFEGTVFSNIALGDPQAENKKVVEMAKIACAHEFIMTLNYGYSTPIGEKGAGLSGGQRQRISLARMLLENPNLIVLDEATSALDVDTEKQVVSNLRNYLKGKTLLMITHRLSSLVQADRIYVMHNGRVDSFGTHSDLMDQKGRYYALYKSQFGESD